MPGGGGGAAATGCLFVLPFALYWVLGSVYLVLTLLTAAVHGPSCLREASFLHSEH